jgi:hypothetical protein
MPSDEEKRGETREHLQAEHGLTEQYVLWLDGDSVDLEHRYQHRRDKAVGITNTHTHEGMEL